MNPIAERIKTISVVIPVFNSETILPELIRRLDQQLFELASKYEVILVNDASQDGSWEVICDLARERAWLRGINLMRNYGQHNALLCGLRLARYEIIITMDDDLQNPPEEIPNLLDELSKGYDVVYGKPRKEQHGVWRGLASLLTKLALQSAMGIETARYVSTFRAFRSQVREAFVDYQGPFVSIDVLLTWGTTRFTVIPVHHDPRPLGVSNYTFRKLIVHALDMITGFSTMPLQLASLVGFLFTLFGFVVLAFVLIRYLIQGSSVAGFPFLASIIAIFSGGQFFALGIIGEYLARIHLRSMGKSIGVIRDMINVPHNLNGGTP